MNTIDWSIDENVAIITMNRGENRFNIPFCRQMLAALDDIEKKTTATALVVTSSHDKVWSNGLDLDWMISAVAKEDPEYEVFSSLHDELMRRVLFYPMITVAALNGHAFASGACLACCFDFRFMRLERGFLCFPEVDINIPFLPYTMALVKKMFPGYIVDESALTGKRYTAIELEQCHAIRKACKKDELMGEAMLFAKGQKKNRDTIEKIKKVRCEEIGYLMDHAFDNRPKPDISKIPVV